MLKRPNKTIIKEIKCALCLGYNTNKPIREYVHISDTTVYEYLQYLIENDSDVKQWIPSGKKRGIYVIRVLYLSNYYNQTSSQKNKLLIDRYVAICSQETIDNLIYYVPYKENKEDIKTINKNPIILESETKERQCGFCGDSTTQDLLCPSCQQFACQEVINTERKKGVMLTKYEAIAIKKSILDGIENSGLDQEKKWFLVQYIQNGDKDARLNTLNSNTIQMTEGIRRIIEYFDL